MENRIQFNENFTKKQALVGLIMVFTQCTKLFEVIPETYILLFEFLCVGIFFRGTLFKAFVGLKHNFKKIIAWSICGFIIIFVIQNILWNSILKQVVMSMFSISNVANSNQSKLEGMFSIYSLFTTVLVVILGPILKKWYIALCFSG